LQNKIRKLRMDEEKTLKLVDDFKKKKGDMVKVQQRNEETAVQKEMNQLKRQEEI